jgi:hypothetical protein
MFNPFRTTGTNENAHVDYVTPPTPTVNLPKEKEPTIFYSVGPTDNGRIGLVVGYSSITMNRAAAESLIKMLQASVDVITPEVEESVDDND